jgi:hypothetical protein
MRASVRRHLEESIRYHEAMAKQADEGEGQDQGSPNGANEDQQELLARTTDLPEGEPQSEEDDAKEEGGQERQDMAGPKLEGEGREQQDRKSNGGQRGGAGVHREVVKQLRQLLDAEPEIGGIERARQNLPTHRAGGTAATRGQQAARDERARYMQQQRRARP